MTADFNHVALHVADLDASIAFYRTYASMSVFDERRTDGGGRVAWLTTPSRRAVLVLVGSSSARPVHRLFRALARRADPPSHLGVALESREEVERRCDRARREGILRREPREHGSPVGFYGIISDPDGNNLELSYDQRMLESLPTDD